MPWHKHIINYVKIQLLHTLQAQDLQCQMLCCTNHSYWLIWQSVAHGQISSKTLKSAVLAWLRRETEIYQKEPLSSEWEKPQASLSSLTPICYQAYWNHWHRLLLLPHWRCLLIVIPTCASAVRTTPQAPKGRQKWHCSSRDSRNRGLKAVLQLNLTECFSGWGNLQGLDQKPQC